MNSFRENPDSEENAAMTKANEQAVFAAQQQAKRDEQRSCDFADYPTSEGWWWYEHTEAPVQARRHRAYGNIMTVYVRAWLKRDEARPGWWHGPMTRPEGPQEGSK